MGIVVETLKNDVRVALDERTIARGPVGAVQRVTDDMERQRAERITTVRERPAAKTGAGHSDFFQSQLCLISLRGVFGGERQTVPIEDGAARNAPGDLQQTRIV